MLDLYVSTNLTIDFNIDLFNFFNYSSIINRCIYTTVFMNVNENSSDHESHIIFRFSGSKNSI